MTTLPVMPQPTTTPIQSEPTPAVPAGVPPGSGVIDPPVTPEEDHLVGDMLRYMDAPSSDDMPQEEIVETAVPVPGVPPQQLGEPLAPPSIEPAPPAQVSPQAPPVAPIVAPVVPVQPQAVAPVVPGAPIAATPAPVPAPQGATVPQPVQPGKELDDLRQGLEAQRETVVKQLAQSYAGTFTDQDIEAIQGPDPAAAKQTIAAMAARIHTDIVQNMMGIIASQMPVMVGRMLETRTQHDRATQEFYGQYPDLKGHELVVNQVAASVRQMHPQMDATQFKNMVAAMVRVSCGLQSGAAPQAPAVPPQQPMIRQPAFQPVAPTSRGPATAPVGVPGNQWGMLNEILQQDERGSFDLPG